MDVGSFDEALYLKLLAYLPRMRRDKAEAYLCAEDRYLSAGAGYLLERALTAYGIKDGDREVVYGGCGKPRLKSGKLFFNLSHSGSVAVCALSESEVGVDVQKIQPRTRELMRKVATEAEYAQILNADDADEWFCRLWTAKESVMKFYGKGLSLSPADIEVHFGKKVTAKVKGEPCGLNFKEYLLPGYRVTACGKGANFCEDMEQIFF